MEKVWITDGIYREIRDEVARRGAQVCTCVEMECDAIAAPAQFRNRSISQSFYSSDNLENIIGIENPLTFAQGLRYNGQVGEQCQERGL